MCRHVPGAKSRVDLSRSAAGEWRGWCHRRRCCSGNRGRSRCWCGGRACSTETRQPCSAVGCYSVESAVECRDELTALLGGRKEAFSFRVALKTAASGRTQDGVDGHESGCRPCSSVCRMTTHVDMAVATVTFIQTRKARDGSVARRCCKTKHSSVLGTVVAGDRGDDNAMQVARRANVGDARKSARKGSRRVRAAQADLRSVCHAATLTQARDSTPPTRVSAVDGTFDVCTNLCLSRGCQGRCCEKQSLPQSRHTISKRAPHNTALDAVHAHANAVARLASRFLRARSRVVDTLERFVEAW
jgi:hypothetical protein